MPPPPPTAQSTSWNLKFNAPPFVTVSIQKRAIPKAGRELNLKSQQLLELKLQQAPPLVAYGMPLLLGFKCIMAACC